MKIVPFFSYCLFSNVAARDGDGCKPVEIQSRRRDGQPGKESEQLKRTNDMNERTITRAERYEQEHPLVERIGRLEIRKNQRTWKFEVSLGVCLWSICVDGLAEARDWAVKANSLMDAGFELYGFCRLR